MREKWLCINRKEYLHDTIMQMRSYERLIHNLTTVTGHFVEEKWRQSNEEIRKREKERKRRKEHTRENVCIRNEMHASKRITISRTKSYTKRFVEREPVQRITPCTENELRWNCGQFCRNKLTWMNELFYKLLFPWTSRCDENLEES